MTNRVVKTKILQRIDTESNWEKVNPILLTGEIAFVQTENNGVLMKVGNGSNYKDIPFQTNIKIDKIPATCFNVEHISQDEYHNLVVNEEIDINTLYVISSDNLNLYGEQIKNVAEPTDENDAVNKKYVDNLSTEIEQKISEIEIPTKVSQLQNDSKYVNETKLTTETQKLDSQIKEKVYVDGNEVSTLNIQHISQDDYHDLVANENVDSNSIYIVSSDNINAYGERITNVAEPVDLSDAVNKSYVDSAVGSIQDAISDLNNADAQLCVKIDEKSDIFVDSEKSNLNIKHISQEEYHNLVATDAVETSVLYIVSSDSLNMYGEQIKNLSAGTDIYDAVNVEQLCNAISSIEIPENISELNNDEKYSKISVDGIAETNFEIKHVSQEEYHNLVKEGTNVLSNVLYVVSSENLNVYNERIVNVADGISANDAATYGQLSNLKTYVDNAIYDAIYVAMNTTYTYTEEELN